MNREAQAITKDAIGLLRSGRERIELVVELLMSLLDELDGDADLEPDDPAEEDDPVEETDPLEPEDGQ